MSEYCLTVALKYGAKLIFHNRNLSTNLDFYSAVLTKKIDWQELSFNFFSTMNRNISFLNWQIGQVMFTNINLGGTIDFIHR